MKSSTSFEGSRDARAANGPSQKLVVATSDQRIRILPQPLPQIHIPQPGHKYVQMREFWRSKARLGQIVYVPSAALNETSIQTRAVYPSSGSEQSK